MNTKIKLLKIKYPDRLPCTIHINKNAIEYFGKESKRMLIPKTSNTSLILVYLRKLLKNKKISSTIGFFIFIKNPHTNTNILPQQTQMIEDLYKQYKNKNDILDLLISMENTFG